MKEGRLYSFDSFFFLEIVFDIFNITFHLHFLKPKFRGSFPSTISFWLSRLTVTYVTWEWPNVSWCSSIHCICICINLFNVGQINIIDHKREKKFFKNFLIFLRHSWIFVAVFQNISYIRSGVNATKCFETPFISKKSFEPSPFFVGLLLSIILHGVFSSITFILTFRLWV